MKTLTIRQVPDNVHEALRVAAAEAGRSMEEQVRILLAEAVRRVGPQDARRAALLDAQRFVASRYTGGRPTGQVDVFLQEKRDETAAEWTRDAQ
ncbi:MAG: plasmid stability protein [Pseudomonadota bacterium]